MARKWSEIRRKQPPDMQKLIAAATRAGIDILGPLPEEPA